MKHTILVIIIFLFAYQSFAESVISPPKGKIKGSVVDKKNKQPLEYATVALYSNDSGQLISGSITDYLGHFKIDLPKKGNYYLEVTFIGLESKKTQVFEVVSDNTVNLGKIFLNPASKELAEVEVVSRKAPIVYKIDKKVINVDKQLTAAAGTAVDILENIPSVQVDIEGNVSLRGSTGFTVLIDGKPTILDPSDALRQIPSSSIENIEIITNPSVKYEPDGATGIINIITKKNYLDGLSGIVNLDAGMYDSYGADLQLNYRINKVSFVFGSSYGKRSRPGDVLNERQTFSNDTTFFVNSSGDTKRHFERYNINGGIEYNPTKFDFISLSGRYGTWGMSNQSNLIYSDFTLPETSLFDYNSFDRTDRGGRFYSVDGVYQHEFKNGSEDQNIPQKKNSGERNGKGFNMKPSVKHLLKLEFNYRNRNNDEKTINELKDLNNILIGGKKNVEKGPSQMLNIKADYTLPIGKEDKFEGGLQYRMGHSEDITELWLYNIETGDIDLIPEYSNLTNYYRNIYAAYSLYAGFVGKLGYQAGLRTEYTDRKVQTTGQNDFVLNRWDFFPTIHTSYNLPHDQQIMASYSRRIDRPRGWELEPFITWQDEYNVRQGNPNLKPEYIDSYDAGYLIKFKDNFVSVEGYYRVTHNKVERVSTVYQENVMLNTIENIGKDFSLGVEVMINYSITKWWDMDLSGNYFNYRLKGTLFDDDFERTSRNWNSRFNNTFRLWKDGQFQLSSGYNSKSVTAQGTSSGYYNVDAAFKVNFMDRNLTANLQVRDIFGTSLRERTSEGRDFYMYYKYTPATPVFAISISYRFNNYKMNKRSAGANGSDDEL